MITKEKEKSKRFFFFKKAKLSSGHYKNSNKTSSCFQTAVSQTDMIFFNLKVIDKPLFQDKNKKQKGELYLFFLKI